MMFKADYRARNPFENALFNHLGTTIALFLILAAASTASATSTLSKVSCGKNAFAASGTDACSVYLTEKAKSKYYVTLQSNNPAVIVPGGVTVKQGALTTGFNATVNSVTTAQTATITAQAGGLARTFSISLSPSTGPGTAALSVNASAIAFGTVTVNSPVSQPLTLSSTGTAALTVSSAAVTGTGFSVSGATFPLTLNPGQSLTIEVQFDPATVGSFSGQLAIASSASAKTVSLSGTGASHQVQLSWLPPTSGSIVGYNVYRALNGSTSYQRLNATADPQTDYTDANVQSGAQYSYLVKSVDAQGVESGPSNTTTAAIP